MAAPTQELPEIPEVLELIAPYENCETHYPRALIVARWLVGMASVREHLQQPGRMLELLHEKVVCECGAATVAESMQIA